MKYFILLFTFCLCFPAISQKSSNIIKISDDIELQKITDNVYMHITYKQTRDWGAISGNGLLYVNKRKAYIFDTPWNNDQTIELINWIEDSLRLKVVGFIPNHWHEDCMGGFNHIESKKIKSYAHNMTIDTAIARGVPTPDNGFEDSLHLSFGKKDICCYYLGAAHTYDNIVIWLPAEKLLFAGCVLKGKEYNNIGFTDHGDIKEYPYTLKRISNKFSEAKIVVPGHGSYGGTELFEHNIKLANKAK